MPVLKYENDQYLLRASVMPPTISKKLEEMIFSKPGGRHLLESVFMVENGKKML